MKVKIGKYPYRLTSNVFRDYMHRKYGVLDWPTESKYSGVEKALLKLEDGLQEIYNIANWVWFDRREQKISVHIDPWDTWSMDETLAHIVLPMLKQLKETKHGAPVVDDDDVPAELRMPDGWYEDKYRHNGETDPHFFDRWDWVMTEMIFAFESTAGNNVDWGDKYHTGVFDRITVPVDADGNAVSEDEAKFYRWDKGPNDTSHFDAEGHRAEADRIQNGFRLFGKYYQHLWD